MKKYPVSFPSIYESHFIVICVVSLLLKTYFCAKIPLHCDNERNETTPLEPKFHSVLYLLFSDEFLFLYADAHYAGLFGGSVED